MSSFHRDSCDSARDAKLAQRTTHRPWSGFLERIAQQIRAGEEAGRKAEDLDLRVPMFRGLTANPLAREFVTDGPILLIGAGVWVLQGVRYSLLDELYSDDWGGEDDKVKTVVQSRRGEGRYVQEEVRHQADLVWFVINALDGRIFVCGSSKGMGEGDERALVDVVMDKGSLRKEEAEAFWAKKREGGQYIAVRALASIVDSPARQDDYAEIGAPLGVRWNRQESDTKCCAMMKRKLNGDGIPEPVEGAAVLHTTSAFDTFGLDARLLQAIAQQKFTTPTEVQWGAIPLALAGKDILARSKTGSGKTAAYVLPILQSILQKEHSSNNTTALILVPTKDLAQQVTKAITTFTAFCVKDVRTVNLTQKVPESVQRSLLAESPDIVVTTPSRAAQNLNNGALSVDRLAHLVIDEADLVLSYGYEEDLQVIAKTIPKVIQSILMSATLTTEVDTLKGTFCRDPVVLDFKETPDDAGGVSQCAEDEKFLLVYVVFKLKLIKGKCIIFVGDIDRCYRLKLFFEQFGIKSCVLNSDLPVNSRIHVVEEFNKNVYDIIIASDEHEILGDEKSNVRKKITDDRSHADQVNSTDASLVDEESITPVPKKRRDKRSKRDKEFGISRGIDFHNIACVLNFDLPVSSKSYTHRIGRTARAGKTGMALSLVVPKDQYQKDKATTFPTAERDEEVLENITQDQRKRGKEVKSYHFDMAQVNAFRYRMTDALRAVTRVAIRAARTRELRQELLKSEKLKRHFEENPEDLRHLRHDGELRAARLQPHLKHVPQYLLPSQGPKAMMKEEIDEIGSYAASRDGYDGRGLGNSGIFIAGLAAWSVSDGHRGLWGNVREREDLEVARASWCGVGRAMGCGAEQTMVKAPGWEWAGVVYVGKAAEEDTIDEMEVIRNALLPRRITQIYTDTKKFYEQIVQEHVTNPQVSSLHLKLRIQKDRLVAWGIEWADSNAQQGDIDDSLDRAGISDLVASIMSSIRELLDDAEKVQPSFQPPGRLPDQKGGFLSMPNREWSSEDLARLGDLVNSITTSIDTLCDLSRSTQAIREESSFGQDKKKLRSSTKSSRTHSRSSTPVPYSPASSSFPHLEVSSLVNSTRIDAKQLVYPSSCIVPPTQPPSYDLVTASPDNRKIAFLKQETKSSPLSASGMQSSPKPVLVDYGYEFDYSAISGEVPALRRYESLVLALQVSDKDDQGVYTGCLKIIGWVMDSSRSRFGFVYEIPVIAPLTLDLHIMTSLPATLLSFLQHSGNTDSENLPSLEDRFRLALNLVTNLLHTHAKGITHRHINSNNIIFVEGTRQTEERKPWKEGVIRKPYLISWDQRADDAANAPEETHVSRLYRHPQSRVGARSAFKPAYDLYSLGLVLLEIGLWMPLHKLWKAKYTLPIFRKKLLSTYAHKLAGKCGKAYKGVVEYCLHAADTDYATPSSQRLSEDYQQAKKQEDFYWKALKPLERCCLIDESNEPTVHPFPSLATKQQHEIRESLESQSTLTDNRNTQSVAVQDTSKSAVAAVQPEQRLGADSLTERGVTTDLLVWSYRIPAPLQAYYKTVMVPKLSRMLARAIDRWEGYTIMTFMAGDSPETAKPTIYMSCLSITRAWKILEYVNRDQKYFDIKVAVGQMSYSKAGKKRGRRPKKKPSMFATASQHDQEQGANPSKYQRKPSCGASIGAFVDEQHLEAVTFGGFVLADGDPFGMSVHHMLEDLDVDHGLDYVLDHEKPVQSTTDGMNASADQISGVSQLDDDFEPSILDQDFADEDDEECFNMGDTLGTLPGKGRDLVITQPALDDVDPAFFPNEDDMSDEHLSSHGLGYVHASSGLKKVRHGPDKNAYEVDWSLFKVCEGRLDARNKVDGGGKYCKMAPKQGSTPHPSQLLQADALGDREVHAIGATSGLAGGKILPTMIEQKMPGRVFLSTVWMFKGDFGVGGDSGAWIIDNGTGAVCGHVMAWNLRDSAGILAPMEVMFHDMECILGKPISLPAAGTKIHRSYKDQIMVDKTSINDEEGDEAVDMAYQSGDESSHVDILAAKATLGQSFGSQFATGRCSADPNVRHRAHHVAQETSIDSSVSSLFSDANTYDLDQLEGTSRSTSPPPSTSPTLPTRTLRELKLDDVAERWTQSQMSRQNLENCPRNGHRIPRKPVQGGLRAQC
ncbi:MAG: hypothetical protein Q9217_005370 [Psora testacea]